MPVPDKEIVTSNNNNNNDAVHDLLMNQRNGRIIFLTDLMLPNHEIMNGFYEPLIADHLQRDNHE